MNYLNDCGGKFKQALKDDSGKTVATLLWGDPLVEVQRVADRVQVRARRQLGWLPAACVGDVGLLELYVIDVGQGDGVLMRTPHDNAWHLIDAGVRAADQMTQKGAANFLRWKFIDELKLPAVKLANVVLTHPDADHFGGIIDVLAGALPDGRTFGVEVQNFWHPGMARFKDGEKLGAKRADTSTTPMLNPGLGIKPAGTFITELVDGKTHFKTPQRAFATEYAALAKLVGAVPKKVKRLEHHVTWLPGCLAMRPHPAKPPSACWDRWWKSWPAAAKGCAFSTAKVSRAMATRSSCALTTVPRACCSLVTPTPRRKSCCSVARRPANSAPTWPRAATTAVTTST